MTDTEESVVDASGWEKTATNRFTKKDQQRLSNLLLATLCSTVPVGQPITFGAHTQVHDLPVQGVVGKL
jgi:hypothetical protein